MTLFSRALTFALSLALLACEAEPPSTGSGGSGGSSGAGSGGSGGTGGTSGSGAGGGGTSGSTSGGSSAGGAPGTGGGGAAGSGGTAGAGGSSGSAGSAGSPGSGGSGGDGFQPCPATGPCKILPLGDSITDGFGFPGGYRIPLFELAVENGKQITFVGGQENGPETVAEQQFPQSHEGHSGWTIQQVDDNLVPTPALDTDPHIILLHIGTNDMLSEAASAPGKLETLIDQILTACPDSLLVVAKIIPFPGAGTAVPTFNATIPPMVDERAAEGKHIVLVDQFEGFVTEDELDDPVHPNPAGYERMANKWWAAISSYLH